MQLALISLHFAAGVAALATFANHDMQKQEALLLIQAGALHAHCPSVHALHSHHLMPLLDITALTVEGATGERGACCTTDSAYTAPGL